MNSNRKGKDGERELADKLKTFGYNTRRGQQYCGVSGDADVIGLPGIHIECKRVEQLNVSKAYAQAEHDASYGSKPAVFHRKNGEQWLVTMSLNEWMDLYKAWERKHE